MAAPDNEAEQLRRAISGDARGGVEDISEEMDGEGVSAGVEIADGETGAGAFALATHGDPCNS